jgi:hypothetical protein
MNLKESYQAVLAGEKPERLPLYVANMSDFLQFYYGISACKFVDDADSNVDVTIRFAQEFNIASVAPAAYIFFGCGPETGVKWTFTGDSLPGFSGTVINNLDDLEKFKIPTKATGYFKTYIEVLSQLNEKIGNSVFLQSFPLGPFAIACFMRGIENAILDPLKNLPFYKKCMAKFVEHSKFLVEQVLKLELPGNILNEIFLSPDMIGPQYYDQHILPYDEAVSQYFRARNQKIPNAFSIFIGKPGDPKSQKTGKLLFNHFFGTKESLDVIREGMQHNIPGFPAIVTLSGRMMATWQTEEVIEFLKAGIKIIRDEFGKYPAIRLTSLQPANKSAAFKMAETLHAIRDYLSSVKLL